MDTTEAAMTIGQRIRELRRARDLTQAQLGERATIDPRNLTRYGNDKLRPSVTVLQRIAHALEVAVDELVPSDTQRGTELQRSTPSSRWTPTTERHLSA